MDITVVKFGGTSLADAGQFRKVKNIIEADPTRRYVVASAPGKRFDDDIKVTDLLYKTLKRAQYGNKYDERLNQVCSRFQDIIDDLGLDMDIQPEIDKIREHLEGNPDRSYMGSRGEYLNSKILAKYLGFPFVDPAECVRFKDNGKLDSKKTRELLSQRLEGMEYAVIAGFYGAKEDGSIQTFSRGGSDITGSIVAEATMADMYENWTDVSGLLAADPRIVENPVSVGYITYRELRILSYMGASVLHRDAVYPVGRVGIPINIRNTNSPEDPGTMIVAERPANASTRQITGIAGFKGVSVIQIEKIMVSDGAGFTAEILDVFKDLNVPFEQCLTGIDTVSVVMSNENTEGTVLQDILYAIEERLEPDDIFVKENMAMIAVVGENVPDQYGATVDFLGALNDAGIEINTINQGAGNLNLIIDVNERDYEKTIRVLYSVIEDKYYY